MGCPLGGGNACAAFLRTGRACQRAQRHAARRFCGRARGDHAAARRRGCTHAAALAWPALRAAGIGALGMAALDRSARSNAGAIATRRRERGRHTAHCAARCHVADRRRRGRAACRRVRPARTHARSRARSSSAPELRRGAGAATASKACNCRGTGCGWRRVGFARCSSAAGAAGVRRIGRSRRVAHDDSARDDSPRHSAARRPRRPASVDGPHSSPPTARWNVSRSPPRCAQASSASTRAPT